MRNIKQWLMTHQQSAKNILTYSAIKSVFSWGPRLTLVSITFAALLAISSNTHAIVGGTPDCSPDPFGPPNTCGHPAVGATSFQTISTGLMGFGVCSGSLIYLGETSVYLTAGHCMFGFEETDIPRLTFDSRAYVQTAGLPYRSVRPTYDLNRYVEISRIVYHPALVETGLSKFNKTRATDMALYFIDEENTALLKTLWPGIQPVKLAYEGFLDTAVTHAELKDGLINVGYGVDEIVTNNGASSQKTVRITTAGERRVGVLGYLSHNPLGWITRSANANHLDEIDATASGDSGSPVLYGDIQVGINKGGIPSVWDIGPRTDTPLALDFICANLPAGNLPGLRDNDNSTKLPCDGR